VTAKFYHLRHEPNCWVCSRAAHVTICRPS